MEKIWTFCTDNFTQLTGKYVHSKISELKEIVPNIETEILCEILKFTIYCFKEHLEKAIEERDKKEN